MNPEIKELKRKIEDKEEVVRNTQDDITKLKVQLELLQENCEHDWPLKWEERVGRDYRCMSGAVDSVFRKDTPDIVAIQYKICKKCGKEMIGKTID